MRRNFKCEACGKQGFVSRDSMKKHVCSSKAEKVVEVESGAANNTAPRNADVVINPVSGAQSIAPAEGVVIQAVCGQKEATVGASKNLKCPFCSFVTDRQSLLNRHKQTKKCKPLWDEKEKNDSRNAPTLKPASVVTNSPVSEVRSDIASKVGGSGGRPTSSGNGRPTYGGKEGERPQKLQEKSGAGSVPVGKLSFAAGKLPTSQMKAKEMSDGGLKTTGEGVAANVPMSSLKAKEMSDGGLKTTAEGVAANVPISNLKESPNVNSYRDVPAPNVYGSRPHSASKWFHPVKKPAWHQLAASAMGRLDKEFDFEGIHDFSHLADRSPWDPLTDIPGEIVDVVGDGNCGYRAVSYWITGSEKYHDRIRDWTTEYMERDPISTIRTMCGLDEDEYRAHVEKQKAPSEFASEKELLAMAEILRTTIWSYVVREGQQYWEGQWVPHRFGGCESQHSLDRHAMYLQNIDGHYSVVLSVRTDKRRVLMGLEKNDGDDAIRSEAVSTPAHLQLPEQTSSFGLSSGKQQSGVGSAPTAKSSFVAGKTPASKTVNVVAANSSQISYCGVHPPTHLTTEELSGRRKDTAARFFEPVRGFWWEQTAMAALGGLHREVDYTGYAYPEYKLPMLKKEWNRECDVPDLKQPIVADGNCLPRALSWCACRDEKYYKQIRQHICAKMKEKEMKAMHKDGKQTDEEYDRWVDGRATDGTWLGTPELITVAHLLDTPIWTFVATDGSPGVWECFRGQNKSMNRPSIYLSNINHHYEVVLSIKVDKEKKRKLLKRCHADSKDAVVDLCSLSPGAICASAKRFARLAKLSEASDDDEQSTEQLTGSMRKVAIGAYSRETTNVTRSKASLRSSGSAVVKNIFGFLTNSAMTGIAEAEEAMKSDDDDVNAASVAVGSEQLMRDRLPNSPLVEFQSPPPGQSARSSKSSGKRNSGSYRHTSHQMRSQTYRCRHMNTIKKRNKEYNETYGTAKKARRDRRYNDDSLRQRTRIAQRNANARRGRTICGVADSPALRRQDVRQRRRDLRRTACKYLLAPHVRMTGKMEKRIVRRITDVIIDAQRREFRQQWYDLHGGDDDYCPMSVNDPRMRWKMRVDRMRAIPLVQARVAQAKRYRRVAWKVLCRKLVSFKKWFQKNEKEINELVKKGKHRKVAIETVYRRNRYHVRTHDTEEVRKLKEYIEQVLPLSEQESDDDEAHVSTVGGDAENVQQRHDSATVSYRDVSLSTPPNLGGSQQSRTTPIPSLDVDSKGEDTVFGLTTPTKAVCSRELDEVSRSVQKLSLDAVASNSPDVDGGTVGHTKDGFVFARKCDKDCEIPSYWAVRMRTGFKSIVESFSSVDTNYSAILETLLVTFRSCGGCNSMRPFAPCTNSASFGCYDYFKLLKHMKCHYPQMRTAIRRYYEMVTLASYIAHVNKGFTQATLRNLSKLLVVGDMPRDMRTEIDEIAKRNVKIDRVNVEADAYAKYGDKIERFRADITKFPDDVCNVCMRMMMSKTDERRSRHKKNKSKQQFAHEFRRHPNLDEIMQLLPDDGQSVTVCHTCDDDMTANRLPRFCDLNNMYVDQLPAEVAVLNTFERLLIQRAKAFLSVVKLKTVSKSKAASGHLVSAMKGNAVHLPLSTEATLQHINEKTPVLPHAGSVQVVVESKQVVNSSVVRQSMVDMKKVTAALIKLKEINPLYADIRIAGVDVADDGGEVVVTNAEQPVSVVHRKDGDASLTVAHVTTEELLACEHRSVIKMYDSCPLKSDCEFFKAQQIRNEPIPDKEQHTDVYCFPRLFPRGRGGMHDERPTKITPSDYTKARLLHISQRFRRDPQYLFFLTALSVMREVHQGIFVCTRTGKKGIQTTIKQFMDQCGALDTEMELRLNQVFQKVRQSSAYWAEKRTDLRCYDEKFGPATFFITVSCAEFDWPDMQSYLDHMDNLTKSHTMSYSATAPLHPSKKIRACDDPVSVMEQFERRFDAVFKNVIAPKDGNGPFGKVDHYFWRVEYQMRGAPHVHMKLWIRDAPVIGTNTDEEVAAFLKDKVTCALPNELTCPDLHHLVTKYQTHSCSASCMRFDKRCGTRRCRYGFPRAARSTMVVNTSELTTKSGSRRTRIVEVPRSDDERRINDYNPALLLAWRANIDVQFVGESSFVLNNYITNYISKKEKSAARDVWEKLDKSKSPYGNLLSLARQLERAREYGSFECSARLLGQHCFGRSVAVDWLGVGLKNVRRGKMLGTNELKELLKNAPESTAFFHSNFIDDYYPNRPDELEQQSLFQTFAEYNFIPGRGQTQKRTADFLPLRNGQGYLKRRRIEKVVKTPMFKPKDARTTERYFQSLLMLFRPWRDEVGDLLAGCSTYQEAFESLKGTDVFETATKFAEARNRIDEAYKYVEKWQNEKVAADDDLTNVSVDDPTTMSVIAPQDPPASSVVPVDPSQLNQCQRVVYEEVMAGIEKGDQIFKMVSGVAGTGKSFLIDCIVASLEAVYGTESGPVAVITAPTGIAAFNVGGTTIHGTYRVPVRTSRSGHGYSPLDRTEVKELRIRWRNARLFIIDEISMVSNTTLRIIHMRLAEVFGGGDGSTKLFGGKSVLLMGDLMQLKPVKADFCFASTAGHPSFASQLCPAVWTGGELTYSELTENMRQKDDAEYADLLSRVRTGCPTDDDIVKLENRRLLPKGFKRDTRDTDNGAKTPDPNNNQLSYKSSATSPPNTSNAARNKKATKESMGSFGDIAKKLEEMGKKGLSCVCLMPLSAQVAEFNDYMLRSTCTDIVTISASDANISSKRCKRPAKAKSAKGRKRRAADTGGLEDDLVIAKGARVMLRRNLDVEKGLVNGAVGKVTDIRRTDNQVSTIRVSFPGKTGVADIERITVEYEVGNQIWNERTQFPLTLAWSMTVHKSQGVSVDSAVVDLSAACFEAGMAYVALSRVRKLDQLYLVSFDPAVLDCHAVAAREYSRLRLTATPALPEITDVNSIKDRYSRMKYKVVTRSVEDVDDEDEPPPPPKRAKKEKLTYEPTVSHVALLNETGRRCYANAVLVCLNNLPQLFTATDRSPVYDELKLINSKSRSRCSARELIRALNDTLQPGNRFEELFQQDAGEFLNLLIPRLPVTCREMFTYRRVSRRRCRNCNDIVSEQSLPEPYLMLSFTEATADCTFAEALSRNLLGDCARLHCPNCDQLTMQDSEEELICGQQFLVVQLSLFTTSAVPDDATRLDGRRIHCFDAKRMTIGGWDYHTVGAVLHTGDTIRSGHYKAMCRAKESAWQLVDDRVGTANKDRFVNLLRNCYLLFMTKI